MRDAKESSNSVDVDSNEVVLVGSWDAGGANNSAIIQIVPILISNNFINTLCFLVHVSSDVEFAISIYLLVFVFISSH